MNELRFETIWFDQRKYEEAESLCCKTASTRVQEHAKQDPQASSHPSSIVDQIAKARETIQQTLKGECVKPSVPDTASTTDPNVDKRLDILEKENEALKQAISCINANLSKLEARINQIDISKEKTDGVSLPVGSNVEDKTKNKAPEDEDDDDDDDDLFGSDEDEEAINAVREQRLKAYAEKKAKKLQVVAKSNIILDVKPWDDETDMALLEKHVRSVSCDGLVWGQSKLVAVGYGIKKLQISCVVEDDKCGTDFLEEEITKFEDCVQSVDVAAFNKV